MIPTLMLYLNRLKLEVFTGSAKMSEFTKSSKNGNNNLKLRVQMFLASYFEM